MRALSIRQPYAELILRGVKTVEYRSKPTRVIGERFLIYAAKARAVVPVPPRVWSADLAVPDRPPPAWMLELAEQVGMIEAEALAGGPPTAGLPTGVIVGSAVIERVTPVEPADGGPAVGGGGGDVPVAPGRGRAGQAAPQADRAPPAGLVPAVRGGRRGVTDARPAGPTQPTFAPSPEPSPPSTGQRGPEARHEVASGLTPARRRPGH